MEQEKAKRKTYTSSAVKKKYNDKTYQRYSINLRKLEDEDCINYLLEEQKKGYSVVETFKRLIRQEIIGK